MIKLIIKINEEKEFKELKDKIKISQCNVDIDVREKNSSEIESKVLKIINKRLDIENKYQLINESKNDKITKIFNELIKSL